MKVFRVASKIFCVPTLARVPLICHPCCSVLYTCTIHYSEGHYIFIILLLPAFEGSNNNNPFRLPTRCLHVR